MTLRDWLSRERRPEYSGKNARNTLRALVPLGEPAPALFGLAIACRTPDVKRLLFDAARKVRAKTAEKNS